MSAEITPGRAPEPPAEAALVTIGQVVVSRSWIVTPVGNVPTTGASITIMDYSRTESRVPTWAVVLAIVGFFFIFLFSLLFLLARETYSTGNAQITVRNGSFVFATQAPIVDQSSIAELYARVAYANQVIAAAS